MKNKMLKFLLRIPTLIVCAAVLTGCTVALALNAQDTQTPLPSTGEQNNPITSVDVFRGMRDEQSGFLYTFSDKAQTQIIYNAMNKCEKLPGMADMAPADYTLIVHYTDDEQKVYLWLGDSSGVLMYANEAGTIYRINDSEFRELRSLFGDIIIPIEEQKDLPNEEQKDLPNTGDLELILKYPPPDMSTPPVQEGLGCYTVAGKEAMDDLLNNADGRIDFVLPEDKDLILEEAIIRSSINIYVKYHDGLTGNTLLFDAHKSNIDFIPEEMKWEMVKYSDQTFYRRTINNDIGLNYTSLYWEKNGWTFVLNIAGEAAQSDIERYINLETISYNADKKMLDWDDLIVEGKENIEKILNKYEGIAFEQHRNYYYDCLITKSIDSLEKFLSTRLNRKDCYIYDGEAEGLPYFRINIEMDGDRITFLLGDVEGDDYKSFSYETNFCPLFPDEISITWLGEEIKDWGSVQLNGIKYFYSVIQNYDKYITTVSWINDGIRFSITTRGSTWGKVDSQIVEQWVSHVKHMMID